MSDLLVYCTKNWFEQYECLETVDLSPVHVASWVLTVDDYRLANILLQLRELKRESNRGIVLQCEKFMCSWTPTEFVEFIDHVKQRLEDAEEVIRFGAAKRSSRS